MKKHKTEMDNKHYGRLLLMSVLSFLSMYILMYSMVDRLDNVFPNFNQFYMAGLMTAPMVLIEVLLMGMMYPDKKKNQVIFGSALVLLICFWFLIRQQTAITDQQFLKSMIPHHAGAVLMCDEAEIHDGEIQKLCKSIVSSQQSEIQQMKSILERLER